MTAPSREVQELAAAIYEALTVPVANSNQPGARQAEQALRLERAAAVRGALSALTDGTSTSPDATRAICAATAEMPVTYPVYQQAEVAS